MSDERRPGPVRYRLRAYEDNYEVMADRVHLTVLDLDTAAGMQAAEVELETTRRALAHLVGVHGDDLRKFRLVVHSWPDGEYAMDWSARR